jgi:hypothetical protein
MAKKPLAAKAEPKADNGTATVTVALKHPTGIVIEAFEKSSMSVPDGVGRLRDEIVFRSTGTQYVLNGTRVPFGVRPKFDIVGGYALTPGVPKSVWDKWLEQHQDHPLVENNLICAHEKIDMVEDFAEEHKATRSGLEPILLRGDPRVDKKRTRDGKFVDSIETADEQSAAA